MDLNPRNIILYNENNVRIKMCKYGMKSVNILSGMKSVNILSIYKINILKSKNKYFSRIKNNKF